MSNMVFKIDPENENIKKGIEYLQEILDVLPVCNRDEFFATYKKARKEIAKGHEGISETMKGIEHVLKRMSYNSFYIIAWYVVSSFTEMLKKGECLGE